MRVVRVVCAVCCVLCALLFLISFSLCLSEPRGGGGQPCCEEVPRDILCDAQDYRQSEGIHPLELEPGVNSIRAIVVRLVTFIQSALCVF